MRGRLTQRRRLTDSRAPLTKLTLNALEMLSVSPDGERQNRTTFAAAHQVK